MPLLSTTVGRFRPEFGFDRSNGRIQVKRPIPRSDRSNRSCETAVFGLHSNSVHQIGGGRAMGADLEGKVVLVTGAASGIGEACARRVAAGGGKVAIVDINEEAAQTVASDIGGDAVGIAADVGDEAAITGMVAEVVERFGRLDGAVNNAAVSGAFHRVGDHPLDDWRKLMRVNLDGVFVCVREEIRAMRGNG